MKIIGVVENTTISPDLKAKHGLSIYIETNKHHILFDLGPNNLLVKNAKKLKIDLNDIDTVIISHGHKDHGGGLKYFLKHNHHAKIYIHKEAFDRHTTPVFGIKFNCGINSNYKNHPQVILTDGQFDIDNELTLFSNVVGNECLSLSNNDLYMEKDGKVLNDDFHHEQNLLIKDNGKVLLLAGCAHRGIVNIVKTAKTILGTEPDICIGGFHLYNPVSKKTESEELINLISDQLFKTKTKYYTCHCTGEKAYIHLKSVHPTKDIGYLSTGSILEI